MLVVSIWGQPQHSKPNQTRQDKTRQDKTRPDQTRSDQTRPNQSHTQDATSKRCSSAKCNSHTATVPPETQTPLDLSHILNKAWIRCFRITSLARGTSKAGGGYRAAAPPPKLEIKKKHRFFRYYDIESFKRFTPQLKPAPEIDWWLVH
jgi:hypothetical protein